MRPVYLKPVARARNYRVKKGPASVSAFGGYDHRPVIADGAWYDCENLSSDQYPLLTVRRNRAQMTDDDNHRRPMHGTSLSWEAYGVMTFCASDRLTVLDNNGVIYCGDYSCRLLGSGSEYTVTTLKGELTVEPSEEDAGSLFREFVDAWLDEEFGKIWIEYDADSGDWRGRYVRGKYKNGWFTPSHFSLADIGLELTEGTAQDGDMLLLEYKTVWYTFLPQETERTMVQMGSRVYVMPDGMWCDVVQLAAGETMVEGENFGDLRALAWYPNPGDNSSVTLEMCNLDGTVYSNVSASSTAPDHQYTWLDTSVSPPELRQWSQASSMWSTIPTVYTKISGTTVYELRKLKAGDAVEIVADIGQGALSNDAYKMLKEMLNTTQILHAVDAASAQTGAGSVVITGVLPAASVTLTAGGYMTPFLQLKRQVPEMDFVVSCENRLWGCRCGTQGDKTVNEIYACKLGDPSNWNVFQGVSTDSYVASRGADGVFTGAAVLDGHPLFFREGCVEKVFPSSSGAHQIQTQTLEGVQQGSHRSLVIIDDRLYYKGLKGVYVYTGTLPTLISPQFGEISYSGATAGCHGKKYYIAMRENTSSALRAPSPEGEGSAGEGWRLFCFDTQSGIWHKEDAPWDEEEDPGAMVSWKGQLFYSVPTPFQTDEEAIKPENQIWAVDGGADSRGVQWYAESGPMGLAEHERKYISKINLRYRLELGAAVTVQVQYDESGTWQTKARLGGTKLHAGTLGIWARRCDTFRLRLEGVGGFTLYSIGWERERGSDT